MLNPTEAAEKASELYEIRNRERKRLDTIRLYLQGRPSSPICPPTPPASCRHSRKWRVSPS